MTLISQSILRLPAVKERTGLSRSTIYSLIKQKKLKAPIRLGERSVGWLQSDVDEFLSERIRASRPAGNEGVKI